MATSDRSYQNTHIEGIVEQVSIKRKVLAQLPTGGGKTYEFVLIAKRYVQNTGNAVLILVHRKELMEQAKETVKDLMGIDAVCITSNTKHLRISRIYIGMVESTIKRLDCFRDVGLVIIDECHIATFNKVHDLFLEESIIGFTATPISSSKRNPLKNYYNAIICGPQIKDLIKLGFLAQNLTISPKDIVDSTQFEIDNRAGDFNENLMAIEYKKTNHVMNVARVINDFCRDANGSVEKTVIFNVNISHSKEVTNVLCMMGFNARHIDSEDDRNRDETLQWFMVTEDAILCNVGIATVGFDEPTILNVISNFSTLSLAKAIQCPGRGGRIIDDAFIEKYQHLYPYKLKKKFYFKHIDMGGNSTRFGDWCDERDWKYIFENPEIPGDGVAPVKTCPACQGMCHAALNVCDCLVYPFEEDPETGEMLKCGHVFDKKKAEREKELGEMILITKDVDMVALLKKSRNKYDYYMFHELAEELMKMTFEKYRKPSDEIIIKHFQAYYHKLCMWWKEADMMAKAYEYTSDIENSPRHINMAKAIWQKAHEKYEKKYAKINSNQCLLCGEETDLVCDDCDYPVCEEHSSFVDNKCTCNSCATMPLHQILSLAK
jgi:superfamily II DNA or RNA helicase